MKKKIRRMISVLLLAAFCLPLCACSPAPAIGTGRGAQVEIAKEAKKVIVNRLASTQVQPPEACNLDWQSGLVPSNGRLYVHAQGIDQPHRICSYDMEGGDLRLLEAYDGETVKGLGASDRGTLYVLNNPYNESSRQFDYVLRELDETGAELQRLSLGGGDYPADFFPFWLQAAGDTVYLLGNGWLSVFSAEGGLHHICDVQTPSSQNMALLPDGRLVLDGWENESFVLTFFDPETRSFGGSVPLEHSGTLLCGGERWNVYLSDGISVFGLDLASGQLEKQFEWLSVGIVGRELLEAPGEGFFAADGENRLFRMRMRELEADENGELDTMTLVVPDRLFLSPRLEDAILDWNREHPECSILVRDYFTGEHSNDWQQQEQAERAAEEAMALDIITGQVRPDLFALDSLNAASLAVSGKLEDLYPYLDGDPELGRESFYPNVLKAQEIRGGLYEVVTNYQLLTVTGEAEALAGTENSWEGLLRRAEERGSRLFTAETRSRMDLLDLLVQVSGKKLVDWDRGEAHFDTPWFQAILEAAAQLPAQGADPAEYYARQPDRSEGEGLLYIEDLGDLWQGACAVDDYRPGSCVITGFPELGSVLYPASAIGPASLGMSSSSAHKAECWAFLRQFYLHPPAYGFSGLQGSLEEEIQRQLQQRDRDGLTDRWPHAEEDMRLFAAAFTGSTVLARQDDTVRDIVRSEAEPFFAGERNAQDCAARIQERVKIYLSEQCP